MVISTLTAILELLEQKVKTAEEDYDQYTECLYNKYETEYFKRVASQEEIDKVNRLRSEKNKLNNVLADFMEHEWR